MKIYIPSMSRYGMIQDGPVPLLPETHRPTLVVPESEVESYSLLWSESADIVGCPEKGIAATRRWIGEHAADAGEEKFLMLDDDVQFLIRRGPDTWRLRGTEGDEVFQMLLKVEQLLGEHAHVGISAREGNNRLGEGSALDVVAYNTRTLRALAYVTEDFLSVEHGRVEVMEDFDVNLQLLRKGRPNANIGYWAQGQRMTNAPGGCSTYRSHEVHERSAIRLAELHSDFVRTRQKRNKTDADGFGTRTEVTIQWKRAFASSASS